MSKIVSDYDNIDTEVFEIFKEYNPKICTNADEGFAWLEDDDERFVIPNPHTENPYYMNSIEIEFDLDITLDFGPWHTHFDRYPYQIDDMIKTINDIISGEVCAISLFDSDGEWYGDNLVSISNISKPIPELFPYQFETKEFSRKLNEKGYTVHFTFWDPKYNKTV